MCMQRPAQSGALRRYRGFSAEEVAEQAKVDRTNASRDLNILVQEGFVERIPGRPVLFTIKSLTIPSIGNSHHEFENWSELTVQHRNGTAIAPRDNAPPAEHEAGKPAAIVASIQHGAVVTSFDTLIGSNGGLKVAIQQAKAAMLYPPRGLHTLLCGPSGVGKTTLARLMHHYALELNALPPDAPFISFNCADYANNPQLLMAHLFGVARGAYTGADRDREGLVEQANRGILFLDEVHRLPPEGQEMLFYLMDRERFRRLGDVHERFSSLLLLAATTEDPATVAAADLPSPHTNDHYPARFTRTHGDGAIRALARLLHHRMYQYRFQYSCRAASALCLSRLRLSRQYRAIAQRCAINLRARLS